MKKGMLLVLLASLVLPACNVFNKSADQAGAAKPGAPLPQSGMEIIRGDFSYSNDFVFETYYVEHAAAICDMTGFILRDMEWELPVVSQVLGFMEVDKDNNRGSYRLQLPVRPAGELNDVNPDGKKETGVQVFAACYSPNLTGGPFSEGDDRSMGWPSYMASVKTDSENQDEVIGGKLLVWAPDGGQMFPSSFGDDGLLFTKDDPVASLPAGYSIVDLDKKPFEVSQPVEGDLPLYEPSDVALKDYSALTYREAFDKMFENIRKEYAFNGVEGKEPDWDSLYAKLSPRVDQAQAAGDAEAFFAVIQDYTFAFHDGHVGAGSELADWVNAGATAGGYGLAIRTLDDGRVLVTYLTRGGPAEKAGIQLGAEVTAFNGTPIAKAIEAVEPLSGPFSTDFGLRYQQERYLLRAPLGTNADISYRNPGGSPAVASLTASDERDSFRVTSLYAGYDPISLPVEYTILDSGIGYIRINSNYDDLGLVIRIFERALNIFELTQVPGIIIDMRVNSGGAPLGLAGFLHDQDIIMGQLEYYSEKTGRFEPEGPPDKVYPNVEQYRFDGMALLVGQACYSACEIEAYGFSQVPGMIVVGEYPTGGVEAEVSRGQYLLPEGIQLQVPTGRYTLPDGSIFLEGKGVQPTLKVPIDEANVLSGDDVVLAAAQKALLGY